MDSEAKVLLIIVFFWTSHPLMNAEICKFEIVEVLKPIENPPVLPGNINVGAGYRPFNNDDDYNNNDDENDYLDPDIRNHNGNIAKYPITPKQLNQTICIDSDSFTNSIIWCSRCIKISYKDMNISVIPTNTHLDAVELQELQMYGLHIQRLQVGAFSHLPSIRFIDLSYNDLKKIIRGTFNSLISLKYLNLSHNSISLIEDEAFHGSVNIEELNLSCNRITNFPDNLLQHFSLRYFDISNNLLTTINDDFCVSLPNLTDLNVNNNLLLRIPECLKSSILNNLYLSYNKIEFLNGTYLPTSLKQLSIGNNKIQSLDICTLQSSKKLEKIDLSFNSLKRIPFECFKYFENLEYMDISGIQMNVIHSKIFTFTTMLKELRLTNNNISFLEKKVFHYLSNLTLLDLSENSIDFIESGVFFGLEKLEVLNISLNRLEYLPSGVFNNLRSLKEIYLKSNKIEMLSLYIFPFWMNGSSIDSRHFYIDLRSNQIGTLNFERYYSRRTTIFIDIDGNNLSCISVAKLLSETPYKNILINTGKTESSENVNGISCHDNDNEPPKSVKSDVTSELEYFFQKDFKKTFFYKFFKNFSPPNKPEIELTDLNNTIQLLHENLTNGFSDSLRVQVEEFLKYENESLGNFLNELYIIVKKLEDSEEHNTSTTLVEPLSEFFKNEIEKFAYFENSTFGIFLGKLSEIVEEMKKNDANSVNIIDKFQAQKLIESDKMNDSSKVVEAINQFKSFIIWCTFISFAMIILYNISPFLKRKYLRVQLNDENNDQINLS